MNKILITTAIACGLLLVNVPAAEAHESRDSQYRSGPYDANDRYSYRRDRHRDAYGGNYYDARQKRVQRMPRWLKRDRSFRRWYKHTRLRKNRRLSWNRLFDIYLWEHSYKRHRRH